MPVVITGRAHHVNPVRLRTSIANDIATVEFSVYEYLANSDAFSLPRANSSQSR
ncbi:uncharacterized protein METZ01_LOCUS28986 [marine metagenome]|uniref:Uncharacterized protein n=1 Tax=marine metagenome TaxID=408172 RepID=A0A381Q9Y0_9ZZZZ